ncbi:MAG TPA: hypothetical protein VEA69_06295 [Tepidisphaeraceae bacterium]|nr:hypothetical protein [Tepidisphaeraceae bacterium]
MRLGHLVLFAIAGLVLWGIARALIWMHDRPEANAKIGACVIGGVIACLGWDAVRRRRRRPWERED